MSDNGIPAIGANQQVAAPSKGKKVAKILIGTALLAGVAATALAAKNGDVFTKVKNVVTKAEGENLMAKAKQIFTKENITKGLNAMKDGFKAIPGQAKNIYEAAKSKAEKAANTVKEHFKKGPELGGELNSVPKEF